MTLRTFPVAILVLICGPALAASSAIRPAPREAPTPPMVFYVAKGAPDACGRGCDSWIAVEGQVDSGAALRFRKFLRLIGNRHLPMYFSSPGGNLDQALKMGAEGALLDLAKTVKFESMHILTREEIVRFGIDRREFVETPWTFENSTRSMVRKSAVAKSDAGDTFRTLQWRLFCFTTGQFELDFQRQIARAPTFATVSISNGGAKPLYFALPPVKPQGFEVWGLRMSRVSLQSLAGLPQFDFTETTLAPDGHRLAHPEKFSTEGLAGALDSLLATCPAQKDMAPLQASGPQDSAAK